MKKHFLFALLVLMMIGINVNVADAGNPPSWQEAIHSLDGGGGGYAYADNIYTICTVPVMAYLAKDVIPAEFTASYLGQGQVVGNCVFNFGGRVSSSPQWVYVIFHTENGRNYALPEYCYVRTRAGAPRPAFAPPFSTFW